MLHKAKKRAVNTESSSGGPASRGYAVAGALVFACRPMVEKKGRAFKGDITLVTLYKYNSYNAKGKGTWRERVVLMGYAPRSKRGCECVCVCVCVCPHT